MHRRFRIGLPKIHRQFLTCTPSINRWFRIGPPQVTFNLLLPEFHSQWILVNHGFDARKARKLPIWKKCILSVLLLAVPEGSLVPYKKTRSRSAVQSILSLAPHCPWGGFAPYKSEEHQFCGALLTERTVCGMLSSCPNPTSASALFPFPM